MKFAISTVFVVAFVTAGSASFAATTDDVKWISQCVSDNKGEPGATPDVALKYVPA